MRFCLPALYTKLDGGHCLKHVGTEGATVTLRNSLGQVSTAATDADGKYVLDLIPLTGTDDTITFEAKGLVGLRVRPLPFNPQTDKVAKPGVIILLPRQRVERVTIQ
jgi:hypothetical protein